MNAFIRNIEEANQIAITGHLRPDGDCVGSCLGAYNYIKTNYPNKNVRVFLQTASDKFSYLNGFDKINHEITDEDKDFDLCIVMDCAGKERLAEFDVLEKRCKTAYCLDHHKTNTGFDGDFVIEPESSSTCEVLFNQLDENKIDKATAECIYTGIVHDTGVFQYSCTSRQTMEIAGKLLEKGIDHTSIISNSFFAKTFIQQKMTGIALAKAEMLLDGNVIYSYISSEEMNEYGAKPIDLDGIVAALRDNDEAEVAVFVYQLAEDDFKVSFRSKNYVDVSVIAAQYGGGGHMRASGCNIKKIDEVENIVNILHKSIHR